MVRINKSVRNVKVFKDEDNYPYELRVTQPKTKSSNKEVLLPKVLVKELFRLNILVKEEKLKLDPAYTDNNLSFPSTTDTYMDAKNLRTSWERALKATGISYIKFHAL